MPRKHRATRPVALAAAAALAAVAPAFAVASAPAQAATTYSVKTLHFKVSAGAAQPDCDIVGDLYLPNAASATSRVPAILTTNGFGGSKDDQAGFGKAMATRGYAVLSYSGLGFGGSDCKITLDDPSTDGVAGSQLVSYLGGKAGIAFLDADHTQPAPVLRSVKRDAVGSDGKAHANDPRVGMIGGSYGGQIQFAVASVDPRVDTIIPMITWNDLSYSLGPNNSSAPANTVRAATPGVAKTNWALGFSSLGVLQGAQNAEGDPSRMIGCPNFADFVCPALVNSAATGFMDPTTVTNLRHASVSSYMSKIRIPTLLMQGESDTLFNLNESLATYYALRKAGVPVKLIWHSWGHSHGTPQPGEFDFNNPLPGAQYQSKRVLDWLNHYLKGTSTSTGPQFAYFRDWVSYTGNAAPAFASSTTAWPGKPRTWYVGATGLTTSSTAATGSAQFVAPAVGAPTSLNPLDALGGYLPAPLPEQDTPGTFAAFATAPASTAIDVVGSPKLTLKVDAPVAAGAQAAGPGGMLCLFVRLRDVAPDGTATDIRQQIAPVRITDATKPVTITMPAIVHRFAAGHRVQLVVAGGSVNYRGNNVAQPVTINGGAGQVLTLPVV